MLTEKIQKYTEWLKNNITTPDFDGEYKDIWLTILNTAKNKHTNDESIISFITFYRYVEDYLPEELRGLFLHNIQAYRGSKTDNLKDSIGNFYDWLRKAQLKIINDFSSDYIRNRGGKHLEFMMERRFKDLYGKESKEIEVKTAKNEETNNPEIIIRITEA